MGSPMAEIAWLSGEDAEVGLSTASQKAKVTINAGG